MKLKEELGLDQSIQTLEHESLLNIVYTGTMINKVSYRYFQQYGITDIQFNVLMQLKYAKSNGLSQSVLSRRLVVNKADMTGIIDRMEKAKLLERTDDPTDRRVYLIKITGKGDRIIQQIEPGYFRQVDRLMKGLKKTEISQIIHSLEVIRANLRAE